MVRDPWLGFVLGGCSHGVKKMLNRMGRCYWCCETSKQSQPLELASVRECGVRSGGGGWRVIGCGGGTVVGVIVVAVIKTN